MTDWLKKRRLGYAQLGTVATVLINIGIFSGVYLFGHAGHWFLFRAGWLHSQLSFSLEELLLAALTGFFIGALENFDRERRVRRAARVNQTTV